jgi:hypothetical protein
MSQQLFIAFVVFATVMFFTPGPNNIMLLSSGLTYGFRRTLPHVVGITIGFAFMVGAVGLGLGTVFIAFPVLQTILKYAGIAYLVYLAVAIAMSGPVSAHDNRRGPMTFWGAAMFHHHRLCRHRQLSLEYRHTGRAQPAAGRGVLLGLGAVRQRAAAGPDAACGGAGLQHRHGRAAAGLALPRF